MVEEMEVWVSIWRYQLTCVDVNIASRNIAEEVGCTWNM